MSNGSKIGGFFRLVKVLFQCGHKTYTFVYHIWFEAAFFYYFQSPIVSYNKATTYTDDDTIRQKDITFADGNHDEDLEKIIKFYSRLIGEIINR